MWSIYCDKPTTTTSGGGGGGTTIINNYSYYACNSGSINWSVMSSPELQFSGTSAISQVNASLPPYNDTGFAAQMSAAGILTLTFYVDVIFQSATVYNASGSNSATFYDKNGNALKVDTFMGSGTTVLTDNVLCRRIAFSLQNLVALGPVVWRDCYEITAETFNYYTGETNFKPLTQNGIFNGTAVVPNGAGNVNFFFPQGTVIYRADFTGNIYLYENGTLVYSGSSLIYSQQITQAAFDTSVSVIVYGTPENPAPLNMLTENFSSFSVGYTNITTANYSASGAIMNTNTFSGAYGSPNAAFGGPGIGAGGASAPGTNAVALGHALYAGGTSQNPSPGSPFSITFTNLAAISVMKFIGSGTITVSGPLNITLTIPNFGANAFYNFANLFYANSLNFAGNFVLTEIIYSGLNSSTYTPPNIINYTFNQNTGETNIWSNYFTVSTADQVNHPPVILNTASTIYTAFGAPNTAFGGPGIGGGGGSGQPGANSVALGQALAYSEDGNAKIPFPGLGAVSVNFRVPVFLQKINYLNAQGSVVVNSTFTVPNYGVNSVQTIFINQECESFISTTSGVITGISFAPLQLLDFDLPTSYLTVANFSTPVPEFTFTAFDTNVGNNYGTPNTAFGGPGIGAGGTAGPGQNTTYRGFATLSNITFNSSYYIDHVDVVNSTYGSYVQLGSTKIYTGNYGPDSVYRIYPDPTLAAISSITISGVALLEIGYYVSLPRQIIALTNSATPVSITSAMTGNYTLNVQSLANGASSIIQCSKGVATNTGLIYAQQSPGSLGERVLAVWPVSSSIQLYFSTLPGIAGTYYYVIF